MNPNYLPKCSGCRWNADNADSLRLQHTLSGSVFAYTPLANTLETKHGVALKGQLLNHKFQDCKSYLIWTWLIIQCVTYAHRHKGWGCQKPVWCGCKLKFHLSSSACWTHITQDSYCYSASYSNKSAQMPLSGAGYLYCVCVCLRVTTKEELELDIMQNLQPLN